MLFPERKQVMTVKDPKTGEVITPQQEKRYLLLLTWEGDNFDDEYSSTSWNVVHGREDVIRYIANHFTDLNLNETYVCSETASASQSWSIYTFCRFCFENNVWTKDLEKEICVSFSEIEGVLIDEYDYTHEELDKLYAEEINRL